MCNIIFLDVLGMSDPVVLGVLGLLGIIFNGIFSVKARNAANAAKASVVEVKKEVVVVQQDQVKQSEVVEKYHKEVNGHMHNLLKTTKALGKAEEKAEEKINGKLDHVLHKKKARARRKK